MTAFGVPSDTPQNNPTVQAPYDETKALRKRVSILEKNGSDTSGFVTQSELTAEANTRASADDALTTAVNGKAPANLGATANLNFPSIAAGGQQTLTVTVTGAVTGQAVAVGTIIGAFSSQLSWVAWVSAANTVSIRVRNNNASGGAAIDPPASDWIVRVIP